MEQIQEEKRQYLEGFHKIGKNGIAYDIIDSKIADMVIEKNNIIVISGKPYLYKDGFYKLDEDGNILRGFVKSLMLEEVITINRINRVVSLILSDYRLKKDIDEVNQYPRYWINFENGMLDTQKLELKPHSPQYLSINQIPHSYKVVDTSKSIVDEFLHGIFPDPDDCEMFLEYAGYCMTTDTFLQRFLVLLGKGKTGKSTLIRLLVHTIGKRNTSNLSLQDLNEKFTPTNLFGKIFNACSDISSKAMEQVDIIKKITGEDEIKGEYKGGKVFFFTSYAKLLFSANKIPISLDDKTNAYYRRFIIIKILERCHQIDNLEEKLKNDSDSFIYLSVQALNRMYSRGAILESQNSIDNVMELYTASDTVMAFINERVVNDVNGRMSRKELLKSYTDYCEQIERTPLTANGFYANLRDKGYTEYKCGDVRGFIGIKYKDNDFEEVREQQLPFD